MNILTILLVAVAFVLLIYNFKDSLSKIFSKSPKSQAVEDVKRSNTIGRKKIKLIPFKEALEASRQFIYNIAKLVMEKFSPSAKENLMSLGKRLMKAGVQYIHVVDVFSLSLQKQTGMAKKTVEEKKKEKGKSTPGKQI